MTKKKINIYCAIAFVFAILFVIYGWTYQGSVNSINEQRLQESINTMEQQMQKNLQYESKDLAMQISQYGLATETQLEALVNTIDKITQLTGEYYVVDSAGTLYNQSNLLNNIRIDSGALKTAHTAGYAAISIPDIRGEGPRVGVLVPLGEESPYFLAKAISAESFMDIIVTDLPIPMDNLILFDEWGGPIAAYDTSADPHIREEIQARAVSFSNNRPVNAYHKNGLSADYYIYVPVGQPQGWFIGSEIVYNEQGITIFGLQASPVIVVLIMVLILGAIILLDIFNDKQKKKEHSHTRYLDKLTGLVSSVGMAAAFEKEISKASPKGYSFVCMDIVTFSRINTMFGYTVGDKLLCIIAEVIKSQQLCGIRINADCFAFMAKTSDDMIEQIENSLTQAITATLGSQYLQMISYKFGVYHIASLKATFTQVYEGALLALKDAKRQAVKNAVYYDESLKESTELQKNIEVNMMHALSKEEFLVYIQPQFDMPGEECTRGETLIRWKSEYMGFLPPDKFIPVFERNGFIVETDFFMLTSALEILEARIKAGKKPLILAVNQSKVTVAFPNYYERLKATVARYNVPLNYIELEITESTLENSWETIVPLIHSIKKLGFSIAMDDFGSGFSSLNTLRILTIDVLKVDKAFLQESDTSQRSKIIIKNVVNMARELSIDVVCEGVETKEQLEFLKQIDCHIVQGYYYAKPMPQSEFVEKYGNG